MVFKVELAPRVKAQLFNAYEFAVERAGKSIADKWLLRFTCALQSLERFPERCPVAPENLCLKGDYRVLSFGRRNSAYHAYFLAEPDFKPHPRVRIVYIVRAAHGPLTQEDLEA
jgi:plasmid stabilization system protein ParE